MNWKAPVAGLLVESEVAAEGTLGVDGSFEEVGVFDVVEVLVGEEEGIGGEVFGGEPREYIFGGIDEEGSGVGLEDVGIGGDKTAGVGEELHGGLELWRQVTATKGPCRVGREGAFWRYERAGNRGGGGDGQ